ncbi:MAG: flagellar assembly protein FliW [Clostridiales bacterium]|nr:flagellar assembly protein FliW [Clostridiales bacterium]
MTKNSSCKNNMPEKQIIHFPEGLLGIPHLNKYIMLSPEKKLPFMYLQSVEEEALAFIVIDPYLYMPDYSFDISDDVIDFLGVTKESDILVLSVVVIPSDISRMTANFAAPVLINVNNRRAKQIVLQDDKYRIRQPIFEIYKSIVNRGA